MRAFFVLVVALGVCSLASAQAPYIRAGSPEAARLQAQSAERPTTRPAATIPLATRVTSLEAQVEQLRAEVARLEAVLAKIAPAEMLAGTPPEAGATASDAQPRPTGPNEAAATPPGSQVGPRGGVYHYSASGKKVYEKHK
jgi:uncharacterized small protein (DUF1192 family)